MPSPRRSRNCGPTTPALPIVVDPVMVSETGAALLQPEARNALITRILPIATVATPNLPEARALTDSDDACRPGAARPCRPRARAADRRRHRRPRRARPTDVYDDGERVVEIPGERYASDASHGSGCTHSSVLAARLAHGDDPLSAARAAKRAAAEAVRDGLRQIGHGPGPVSILRVAD